MGVFDGNVFDANVFDVEEVVRRIPLDFFGGYSEDDFKKYREKIDELSAAGELSREEAERLRDEFNQDVFNAFHPPEEQPQEVMAEAPVQPEVVQLPKPAVSLTRAFEVAELKQREEEEMIALLFAA